MGALCCSAPFARPRRTEMHITSESIVLVLTMRTGTLHLEKRIEGRPDQAAISLHSAIHKDGLAGMAQLASYFGARFRRIQSRPLRGAKCIISTNERAICVTPAIADSILASVRQSCSSFVRHRIAAAAVISKML